MVKAFSPFLILISVIFLNSCVTVGEREDLSDEVRFERYINAARAFINTYNYAAATNYINKARNLDDNHPKLYETIAVMKFYEGKINEAEEFFKKALSKNENDAKINNNYAVFLYQNKKYDESKIYFKKALEDEKYSNKALIYYNVGMINYTQQNCTLAKENFYTALKLNTVFLAALYQIAECNYMDKEYKEAVRNIDILLLNVKLDINSQIGTYELGVKVYEAMGQVRKALEFKQKIAAAKFRLKPTVKSTLIN